MNIFDQIKSGRIPRKAAKDYMKKESRKLNNKFIPQQGEHPDKDFIKAMRNKDFFVQIFKEEHATRLSINRTELNKAGTRWRDGITWDEIYNIKNQLGYKDKCAVELYPPENKIVDVANIRHIFVLDNPPAYMWMKLKGDEQ